jgi:hypothetical protein
MIVAFLAGLVIIGIGLILLWIVSRPLSPWIDKKKEVYIQLLKDILHQAEFVDTDEKATRHYLKLVDEYD